MGIQTKRSSLRSLPEARSGFAVRACSSCMPHARASRIGSHRAPLGLNLSGHRRGREWSHRRVQVAKGAGIPATSGGATTVEFKRIEPDVAINDINQPTLVEHHVVALRSRSPARGFGDEIADFARGRWVCNVDNAQAGAEPHCKYERPSHAFVELMGAEPRARHSGEW